MKLEEIDEEIAAKEQAYLALQDEIKQLHLARGALTDQAKVEATFQDLTPSQRDVVIKLVALHHKAELPQAD